MKTVFSKSSEVLHRWANQTQPSARQSTGQCRDTGQKVTRCFFEGKSCYSYGRHYELGRLVSINGRTVALINTEGHSVTTAKHIGEAKSAASHMPIIEVDGSFDWHAGLLRMQDSEINWFMSPLNELKPYGRDFKSLFSDFNALCVAVGMPHLQLMPDAELVSIIQEHVTFRTRINEERETALKAKHGVDSMWQARRAEQELNRAQPEPTSLDAWLANAEKRIQKAQRAVDKWKTGQGPLPSILRDVYPQLIRVHNGMLETSGGVSVPYNDAVALATAIKQGIDVVGQQIQGFKVREVTNSVVTIGCHQFSIDAVEQVLKAGVK